ncbi:acyl-protein synthetase [Alteromonas flava]|uniref:LuxE/PaaK family acyltransferase n=1 Tax=Alteromonas flava TaxID=2048003 RepID=UPI001F0B7D82|nr:acyl-protein synthetase [Alteromonas flava]
MTDLSRYEHIFSELASREVFGCENSDKAVVLYKALNELHHLHCEHCPEYQRIVAAIPSANVTPTISSLPYIAVRLFKLLALKSVPEEAVFRVLQSSGTTSQVTAKVFLDKVTSQRQSKVLVAILQQVLGKKRLPMLIIDAPATVNGPAFNARAAGIQGLAFFGRHHTYALHDDMTPNWAAIDEFCAQYGNGPVLVFGFTFMVWRYFIQALQESQRKLSLPQGILLHSGGWKKLEHEKVTNHEFKQQLLEFTAIAKVHNFYGMAEQVGSIFVECEHGYLHAPSYADVIVRDTRDLSVCAHGQAGLIQVLSAIPSSYPGHSILTEDLGVIHGEDDCPCGWSGKYFSVSGRLPKAEVRGCSDTHAAGVSYAK